MARTAARATRDMGGVRGRRRFGLVAGLRSVHPPRPPLPVPAALFAVISRGSSSRAPGTGEPARAGWKGSQAASMDRGAGFSLRV